MTKPKPETCGDCPHLVERTRRDFYPPSPDYECGAAKRWIGFVAVRPEWCPKNEADKT